MENLKSSKTDVIANIAQKYCELLETFEGQWENPIIDFRALNNFSKKCYRGFNLVFLGFIASRKNCNKFATFKQWTEAGFRIKKGAKGIPVFFWKSYIKKTAEALNEEPIETDGTETENTEEKKPKEKIFLVARQYTVFNGADVEGFNNTADNVPADAFDVAEVARIETFFNTIENGAKVERILRPSASYNPISDVVNVPPTVNYKSLMELCGSFAHEFAHSTGHQNRLNRDLTGHFGDAEYAREELIAEISAGMIAGHLGFAYQFDKQVLAYLKSWLRAIPEAKEKGKLLLSVCKEAQKATDWVISHSNLKNQ